MAWDTTEFCALVRQELRAPGTAAQAPAGLDDTSILRAANFELFTSVVLEIIKTHELYLTRDTDTVLVSGTSTYATPSRCILGKAHEILYVDGTGVELELVKLVDRNELKPSNPGVPTHFRFQDNSHLVLYPTPNATGTLRLVNYRRPNRMVAASTGASGNIGLVSSKTSTTVTLTGAHPTGWGIGTKLDFISALEPFAALAEDIIIESLTSTVLTPSGGTPPAVQGAAVADIYVCLAQEAPVVQLPIEYFHLLASRTVARMQKGGADGESRSDAAGEAVALTESVVQATEDRDDGQPAYIQQKTWD